MKILVTGGNGFLGKAVVERLRADEHKVFAPRSKDYDLRQGGDIQRALMVSDPEVIVHLAAAVGGIGANTKHPGEFLYENAVMGLQLMERARPSVRKFVTVGTACEYPRDAPMPLREETIWDGYPAPETAPYGLAKRLLLAQGQAYREQYGFDAIHLIPTNLYGPGDNFDPETSHVIPGMIRNISEAKRTEAETVRCWGTGLATREFLYVTDAAEAIVQAMDAYSGYSPVNIGTGVETPVWEVAGRIADVYGYTGDIIWDTEHPDGASRRWMDTTKAKGFGFYAQVPLDEGLSRTIEWYET